jgi:riboflavin transporter
LIVTLEFPLLPQAPFLKYDPSEVPAMIGAFAMGAKAGLAIIAVKCTLFFFYKGDLVGTVMAFAASLAFTIPAALFYGTRHTLRGACIALIVGTVTLTLGMIPVNIIVLPYYFGMPLEQARSLAIGVIPVFNLVKGILNSILTFILYKRVSPFLKMQ